MRVRLRQRLELDDGFLLMACICLTAGTVLLFDFMPDIYLLQHLRQDSASVSMSSRIDVLKRSGWIAAMENAYVALSQVVLYSIKASFLCFFRRLIDRLGTIVIHWRVTASITAISFLFGVCEAFIVCPETGLKAGELFRNRWYHSLTLTQPIAVCDSKERISHRMIPGAIVSLLLNIGTDIMSLWLLASFPSSY